MFILQDLADLKHFIADVKILECVLYSDQAYWTTIDEHLDSWKSAT